jgi:hypothetical protein
MMNMPSKTTGAGVAPGPTGRPLRGNLPEFRNDRYNYLIQLHQQYGDVVHFQLGKRAHYLAAHPDDVLHVLGRNSSNYHKAQNRMGDAELCKSIGCNLCRGIPSYPAPMLTLRPQNGLSMTIHPRGNYEITRRK